MSKPPPLLIATLLAAVAIAPSAMAQTFDVKLATAKLGTLTYANKGDATTLRSKLAGTPMGVFNGTFNGTSQAATAADGTAVTQFTGISKSSRKSRKVEVQIAKGRAMATQITPAAEETALSDPANVAGSMINPVRAVGRLINASGCPKRINIYDGRRAIALIPKSSETKDGTLICAISYKVTAGPGHLSPLKISSAKMQVRYDLNGGSQKIREITLGSGVFNLVLERVR